MPNSFKKHIYKLLCSVIVLTLIPVTSLAIPDLTDQGAWGENEKGQFIKFLESGKQLPIRGDVKSVATSPGSRYQDRKAKYVTVNFVTSSLLTSTHDGTRKIVSSNMGAKLLFGGHVFSWVRYYSGLQYSAIDQAKSDGKKVRLNHYEIPFGVELALIPLGTPHTRYVLLRGGVSAHYVEGNYKDEDFNNSLLGFRGSWNMGLGYEWQIADTSWRVNTLIEGFRSMSREKGTNFSGAGLTAGVAYTF